MNWSWPLVDAISACVSDGPEKKWPMWIMARVLGMLRRMTADKAARPRNLTVIAGMLGTVRLEIQVSIGIPNAILTRDGRIEDGTCGYLPGDVESGPRSKVDCRVCRRDDRRFVPWARESGSSSCRRRRAGPRSIPSSFQNQTIRRTQQRKGNLACVGYCCARICHIRELR